MLADEVRIVEQVNFNEQNWNHHLILSAMKAQSLCATTLKKRLLLLVTSKKSHWQATLYIYNRLLFAKYYTACTYTSLSIEYFNYLRQPNFLLIMFSGVESSAETHDSSIASMIWGHNWEQEMDTQENFSSSEITHQSVNALIQLETEPDLRQVEKLRTLLAERNALNTAAS